MWSFDYWIALIFIGFAAMGIIGVGMAITVLCEKIHMTRWMGKFSPIKQTEAYKNISKGRGNYEKEKQ